MWPQMELKYHILCFKVLYEKHFLVTLYTVMDIKKFPEL